MLPKVLNSTKSSTAALFIICGLLGYKLYKLDNKFQLVLDVEGPIVYRL